MKTVTLLSASVIALALFLPARPCQAQNNKSFVSATGVNSNPCTRAAPCDSIGAAAANTFEGGEVSCLETGLIGAGTVQKSITIDCGGTAANTFDRLVVEGAGIVVRIRNLTFSTTFSSGPGIDFRNGATLIVENCVIENFKTNDALSGPPVGIWFRPTAGAQLIVSDTLLSRNGNGSIGGGIVVNPRPGGSAQVTLTRVTAAKNTFGIVADGTGSTGGINMTISDSVSSGNSQDGIIAVTPGGGAPIGVMVKNTKSVNNQIGIRSIGPGVTVRVDGSAVIGNGTGLAFGSGGALLTFGNNNIAANGINGAFSGSIGLQ